MPCLLSGTLESMEADGENPVPGSLRCSEEEKKKKKKKEKGKPVVMTAGWFFSPLWSPRCRTKRWGLGNGKESEQVEAWLDDHSDYTRDYFLRRTSTCSGSTAETALKIPPAPRSSDNKLLTAGRHKSSSPVSGQRRLPDRDRLDSSDPFSPDATRRDSLRSPSCPRSPRSRSLLHPSPSPWPLPSSPSRSPLCHGSPLYPNAPRSPSRKAAACGRGESCRWMTGLLSGGISRTSSVEELCQGALLHAGDLLAAGSWSLSLVRKDRDNGSTLEEVVGLRTTGPSEEDSASTQAHLDLVKSIVGYVAATRAPINMRDTFEDPRFKFDHGESAGFKLKSVLSTPIKNHREEIVGVAVMINKKSCGEGPVSQFTDLDEKVLSNHMAVLGMVLDNAQLYESSRQEAKRSQVLLEMAKVLSEQHLSFEVLLGKMAATIMPFTRAQYCTIFIAKDGNTDYFSSVVHMECEELGPSCQIYRRQRDINDVDLSQALHTLRTMETLNMADNTQESVRSLICCPVRNERSEKAIAVCQLKNKLGNVPDEFEAFSRYDERLLEDLAVYCGLSLQYAQTVQITEKRRASIEVTQEVLAYHITATEEEIRALQEATIPSAEALRILDFHFSDFGLPEELTTQATVRMFLHLNLVQDFNIDFKSLCQWVLSVKRGYRNNVPYHNWSHGLSTAQCMFAMLMATDQLKTNFSRLEILALMIATLNHDLDHRGVNNSYIQRTHQPLAQLYGHSSLENHHYNLCLFILNNSGSQILSGLSKEDYKAILPMIKRAILATDLTVYMQRRKEFFSLTQKSGMSWKSEKERELLRSMLMTASDICAITKPWPEQRRIASLVAMEFFAQGDKEKRELNIKPIDVMNRENSTRLPHMQVEYIEEICHPLYKALSSIFDSCSPLLNGCETNKENWLQLAEGIEEEDENNSGETESKA